MPLSPSRRVFFEKRRQARPRARSYNPDAVEKEEDDEEEDDEEEVVDAEIVE